MCPRKRQPTKDELTCVSRVTTGGTLLLTRLMRHNSGMGQTGHPANCWVLARSAFLVPRLTREDNMVVVTVVAVVVGVVLIVVMLVVVMLVVVMLVAVVETSGLLSKILVLQLPGM